MTSDGVVECLDILKKPIGVTIVSDVDGVYQRYRILLRIIINSLELLPCSFLSLFGG